MFMLCLVGMCHAPAPPHHQLLPLAKSCLAMCPNPTAPTLRNRTSESLLTYHPHPTRFPSLSLLTCHSFVVSTPALPILATFLSMACVLKRFPLTSPCKIGPDVREKASFTHGRASLSFVVLVYISFKKILLSLKT